MSDLLSTSAATWRDPGTAVVDPVEPDVVPAELVPPRVGTFPARLAAWRQRHLLRERRAERVFRRSRDGAGGLPVSDGETVRDFVTDLIKHRSGLVALLLVVNVLAAVAGLVVPRVLGVLIDGAVPGADTVRLDQLALGVAVIVALQALLTFGARFLATVFGQDLLSTAREFVVRMVLRLPLGRVEQASTGDLVTRVTRDVGAMSGAAQWAIPTVLLAGATVLFTFVAMVINSWLLALPMIVCTGLTMIQVRRYLRRSPGGYITEGSTYSRIGSTLTETVEGVRTVEALRLRRDRVDAGDHDIAVSSQAERYTMALRNLLFAALNVGFGAPLGLTVLLGAYGFANGWVTMGQIAAATLYISMVTGPLDQLIHVIDRLQVAGASTARLLGIADVPPDREEGPERPDGPHLVGQDLRFAYRDHDVLHGVDLDLVPGERLAIVGPSGSGKSTLGRLLAGINGPRTGRVTVGGVDLVRLPIEQLRTEVALVTQEHHVFVGTVHDNIVLAREDVGDDVVEAALRTVDAWPWVSRMADGTKTMLGSGHHALTPAQAQQIALARLVVADPHTLVLDEATSLIDPRTARHLEGSMSSLLEGRTVVAIAHRLHTAHDADRIAVVIDGRIVELGDHHELVARGGEYARLWEAWSS
ncbi:ABC transporter ATP-binding protein [Propionibacteriaceae bacterium Y2011]